jgi:transglutaminase-like putative cysteine protease
MTPSTISICFLEWPEALRTKRLSIVSTLDLTHHPEGPPLPVYSLDPAAEAFPYAYSPEEFPDLSSLAQRQEPDPDGIVGAWARRFVRVQGETRTLAVMEAMTHAIKAEFRYEVRHEHGTRTAAETIALGSGACRDFAVLMMEALRSFGVATRFVTGYLYDDTSGATRGGGSTHAWCNVYLPGAGWMEYDPTTASSPAPTSSVSASQGLPRGRSRSREDMSAPPMIRLGSRWTSRSAPRRSDLTRQAGGRARGEFRPAH